MQSWGNEFPKSCICILDDQRSMDTLQSGCQYGYKHTFDTGAAVPWDIADIPNAPACRCQEWCCWDECHLHHCAHSPIHAAADDVLLQMWVALFFFQELCCYKEDIRCRAAHGVQLELATHGCRQGTSSKLCNYCQQCLIRRLGILVLIPVSCLSRCLDSKRLVLADFPPFTIGAFAASCAAGHLALPDMWASCWTVGA